MSLCVLNTHPLPSNILSMSPNLGHVGTTWHPHQNLLKIKIYLALPPLYHDFTSAEIIESTFIKNFFIESITWNLIMLNLIENLNIYASD